MSRTAIFNNRNRDSSPLLSQPRDSISLSNISSSPRDPRSQTVSPSPPPSFYRDNNDLLNDSNDRHFSPSPSKISRSPDPRRTARFAPPPPPITSLYLPTQHRIAGHGESSSRPSSLSREAQGGGLGQSTLHIRRGSNSRNVITDPLIGLQRRERAIQKELQLLLDAQSAGLVQGFGGSHDANDGASEAGSSTPTMSQSRLSNNSGSHSEKREKYRGVVPVRQPRKKPLGLRRARRALGRDMGELLAVKAEESSILTAEIERREEVLEKVTAWELSISNARTVLTGGGEEEDREISELKNEELAVTKEILELEERLHQMRARKKWLGERLKEEENKREARLSSYKGALREVEREVEGFLSHPPLEVSVVMGGERGFTALPEKRRTLGMAREWWGKEIGTLSLRKKDVEEEHTALEDGRKMWEDSTQLVTDFEDGLRSQMASGEPQTADGLGTQIDKMGAVIEQLEQSFKEAEEKGWNLLICAVGAELEAFKEGHEIFKGALDTIAPQESRSSSARALSPLMVDARDVRGEADFEKEDSFHSTDSGLHTLDELNGALKREVLHPDRGDVEESDDDGPDLSSLLVDRGHVENIGEGSAD